jgi:small-conductance mechanosensitive channel
MNELLTNYATGLFATPIVEVANRSISIYTIFYVALIVVIANIVYLSARLLLNIQIKKKKVRSAQGRALLQLFGYVVTITAFFFILNTLGYSLSYLLVGSTALLVGIGFGLQQLFVDVISGIILLIDKDVNLGDVVRVDIPSGKENIHGKIYHIGLRATLLQTIDNEFMIVPNSKILSSGITSLMKDKGSVRFRIHIQVEFNQDIDIAKEIMTKAILKSSHVDKNPAPTVIIKDFKDSGILLEARFWMKELFNTENFLSEIRGQILDDFRKQNINIPYPHIVYQNNLNKNNFNNFVLEQEKTLR